MMKVRWERWARFCDAAAVAPDTLRTAEDLATRYVAETGRWITAVEVSDLMPEGAGQALYPKGPDHADR